MGIALAPQVSTNDRQLILHFAPDYGEFSYERCDSANLFKPYDRPTC